MYQKHCWPIFFVVVAGFFLASCIEFKEPELENSPVKQLKLASFEIKELESPNRYAINVRWTEASQHVVITFNQKEVLNSSTSEKSFDIEAEGGSSANILVEAIEAGKKTFLGELNTLIPRDFVFESDLSLESDLSISANRIFLPSRTKIVTNGFNFTIKGNKFVSEDSEIISFLKTSQAPPLTPGRSGGKISINAKDAVGNLRIELRGEKGGNGQNGASWGQEAQKGVDGKDSEDGSFENDDGRGHSYCVRDAGSGGPGVNGARGRDGSPGEIGGDSGTLLIHIENNSEFKVSPQIEAGESGVSGIGGSGQAGGEGGDPGTVYSNCKPGNKGPTGRPGDAGTTPPPKGPGQINQSTIIIGKKCSLVGREVRTCSEL